MKKKNKTTCERRAYTKFLRDMIKDAREITGAKKVPSHLRTAVKSHAERLAKVSCANNPEKWRKKTKK